MNICFPISFYESKNLFFSDPKKNIIMDGKFTKTLYSNELITINGIYLKTPLKINNVNRILNKYYIKFYPDFLSNIHIINSLIKIEKEIIDYYCVIFNCKKKPVFILKEQMLSGSLKIYRDNNVVYYDNEPNYIIKISGVWEDHEYIGITYKLFQTYSIT
jgi:hypothetical protein